MNQLRQSVWLASPPLPPHHLRVHLHNDGAADHTNHQHRRHYTLPAINTTNAIFSRSLLPRTTLTEGIKTIILTSVRTVPPTPPPSLLNRNRPSQSHCHYFNNSNYHNVYPYYGRTWVYPCRRWRYCHPTLHKMLHQRYLCWPWFWEATAMDR